MSIAICPRCKTSANAGMCFTCNTPMTFDEYFPDDRDEDEIEEARMKKQLENEAFMESLSEIGKKAAHTARTKPLTGWEVNQIEDNLGWAQLHLREAEGTEALRVALQRVRDELNKLTSTGRVAG